MANLNKVMLIGRLAFDPEPIQLSGSTAGAKFRFVVSNRKQNKQTQQWEDVPVYLDIEIWNRGESKQADRVLSSLRRGSQIYIEGHLKLDEWDDKNGGGKRSKVVIVAETFQYLESKQEGEARLQQPPAPSRSASPQQPAMARSNGGNGGGNYGRPNGGGYNGGNGGGGNYDDGADYDAPASQPKKGGSDDDIPF